MALPIVSGSDGAWGTTLNNFLGGAAGDGTPTIPNNRIPYLSGGNHTSSANLTFDGTTLTIPAAVVTASAALTITPAAGSNLNIALSTTGDFAVNTNQLYVDTSTGNVILGGTSGAGRLAVSSPSSEFIAIEILSETNTHIGSLYFSDAQDTAGAIHYDHANNRFQFRVGGVNRNVVINSAPNIGLGSLTFGAGAVNVFTLGNGTAPGALTSTASIVALTGEMWAYDSGGVGTQLSAHPADFLATMPVKATGPYALPWAWHTKSPYLGKRITVDMAGLVEAIEALTLKKFTTLEDLPIEERRDWDTDQEAHRLNREKEIIAAQNQIAALDAQINAEADPAKKVALTKQRDSITVPASYVKQRPAKWMVDRGAKTAIVEA